MCKIPKEKFENLYLKASKRTIAISFCYFVIAMLAACQSQRGAADSEPLTLSEIIGSGWIAGRQLPSAESVDGYIRLEAKRLLKDENKCVIIFGQTNYKEGGIRIGVLAAGRDIKATISEFFEKNNYEIIRFYISYLDDSNHVRQNANSESKEIYLNELNDEISNQIVAPGGVIDIGGVL